jgi:hypothetical protein
MPIKIANAPTGKIYSQLVAAMQKFAVSSDGSGKQTGATVNDICTWTGLKKSQVFACLKNHQSVTFTFKYNGFTSLWFLQPQAAVPAKTPEERINQLLESRVVMSLEELYSETSLPRRELFRMLQDETKFQREHEGSEFVYRLRKRLRKDSDSGYMGQRTRAAHRAPLAGSGRGLTTI